MMMFMRRLISIVALVAAAMATVTAQPPARRATTIEALRSYPGFYHQQTVMVVGEIKGTLERATIGSEEGGIALIARELPRDSRVEARGQFLDVGRMSEDDPRLIPFNLLERIRAAYQERWPKPGEELLLMLSSTVPPPAAANVTEPPLRTVAMEPQRFENQKLTLVGQFRGRNLFGDLPEAPVQNRYSFVLRSSDAAVWVMGVQPKGRNFSFDPARRLDTGRWVKVSGTVKTAKGLTWIEGTTIELAPEPAPTTTEVEINVPPPPPVEVLFTAPAEGEADVRLTERIRMQLSRDLNAATLKDRVRLTYSSADSKDRGEAQPPSIAFTTNYARENRALEIRPTEPLARFRLVTLEILPGVKGTDGGDLLPFKLTFTTGGS
jgi:hypothetical protein